MCTAGLERTRAQQGHSVHLGTRAHEVSSGVVSALEVLAREVPGHEVSVRDLVLATQNRDKVRELAHALLGLPLRVLSVDDLGPWPEVEETGTTLEENARLKVQAALSRFGLLALGDDTGLEVDALGGAPGVYSSRYAGPHASYRDNVNRLVLDLTGVPESHRTARFRCVVALADPDGRTAEVDGVVEGRILTGERGEEGFGYDPVFWVPAVGKTFAEMTLEEKRSQSHRGRALARARRVLEDWYGWKEQ